MRYVLRWSPDVPSRSVRVCAVMIMTSNGLELLDRQVACSVVNVLYGSCRTLHAFSRLALACRYYLAVLVGYSWSAY